MLCKTCGTNNEQGVAFCINCGTNIENPQEISYVPEPTPVAPMPVIHSFMSPERGSKFVGVLKKTATSPAMLAATVTATLACICSLVASICIIILNGSLLFEYETEITSLVKTGISIIANGAFIFNLITVVGLFHAISQGSCRKPTFSTIGLTLIKGVQIANAAVCIVIPFVMCILLGISNENYEKVISTTAGKFYGVLFLLAICSIISLFYVFAFNSLSNCRKSAFYGEKPKPVSKILIAGCFAMIFLHIFIANGSLEVYKRFYSESRLFDYHLSMQERSYSGIISDDYYDYEYGYGGSYGYDYDDYYDYEYGYGGSYGYDYDDYYDYEYGYGGSYGYDYDDYYDYEYGYGGSHGYNSMYGMPAAAREKAMADAYGTYSVLMIFSMLQTLFTILSCVFFAITAWNYNNKLKRLAEAEEYAASMRL